MFKRTKIIATLGPSTDDRSVLEAMMTSGMDIVRVNFSHGTHHDQIKRIELTRAVAKKLQKHIGILADMQGPKIRITRFKSGAITLTAGDLFTLDADFDENAGDHTRVGITYKRLPKDVSPGDSLLLDDGLIVLKVKSITGGAILCSVQVGGILSDSKGINRQGGGLTAEALTDKDIRDIAVAIEQGVDYIALSFPRNADDILKARAIVEKSNRDIGIIAKIERTEAVANIDSIIQASHGVMVARGDLCVEIGDAELIGVQKHIIQRARSLDKPVITATQMMESMVHSPIPTRAEVSDVANAVLDGTDAVMLSAESATGEHPAKAVEAMARVCMGAEKSRVAQTSKHRVEQQFSRVDEAIAMATMYTANHFGIKAIIALTESGSTPLWMSRIRSGIPIFALSRNAVTLRRVTLYRGVYPILFDVTKVAPTLITQSAVMELKKRNLVDNEDLVILTHGDVMGIHGRSNAMKIVHVKEVCA